METTQATNVAVAEDNQEKAKLAKVWREQVLEEIALLLGVPEDGLAAFKVKMADRSIKALETRLATLEKKAKLPVNQVEQALTPQVPTNEAEKQEVAASWFTDPIVTTEVKPGVAEVEQTRVVPVVAAVEVQAPVAAAKVKVAKAAPKAAPASKAKPAVLPKQQLVQVTPKVLTNDKPKQAYRLEGTERVEMIGPLQAKVRNQARGDGKKWVLAPELAAEATTPVEPLVGEARVMAYADGRKKDQLAEAAGWAWRWAKEEADKAADKAVEKTEKLPVGSRVKLEAKPQAKPGRVKLEAKPARVKLESKRANWNGFGMCDVIRWCGAEGLDRSTLSTVMTKLGFEASPTTIYIQYKKGASGENVPKLSKEQAKAVKDYSKAAK